MSNPYIKVSTVNKISAILKEKPLFSREINNINDKNNQFNVYKIPIELITLNPFNSRIQSDLLKWKVDKDEEKFKYCGPEGQKKIRDLIIKKRPKKNEKTSKSLIKSGQKNPGVITRDGVLIDGNRRFSLILENNEKINSNQQTKYFHAIIEKDIYSYQTKKILDLEIKYQQDEDPVLNRQFVDTLILVRQLTQNDKDYSEIKKMLKLKNSPHNMIKTLKLMEEYLEIINKKNNYDFVSHGLEELFKNLELRNRQLITYGTRKKDIKLNWSWKTEDLEKFKPTIFKFIRFKPSYDKFFQIINLTNKEGHLLYDSTIWKHFLSEINTFYEGFLRYEQNEIKEWTGDLFVLEKKLIQRKKSEFNEKIFDKFYIKIQELIDKNNPTKLIERIEKNTNWISEQLYSQNDLKITKRDRKSLKKVQENIEEILEKIEK